MSWKCEGKPALGSQYERRMLHSTRRSLPAICWPVRSLRSGRTASFAPASEAVGSCKGRVGSARVRTDEAVGSCKGRVGSARVRTDERPACNWERRQTTYRKTTGDAGGGGKRGKTMKRKRKRQGERSYRAGRQVGCNMQERGKNFGICCAVLTH